MKSDMKKKEKEEVITRNSGKLISSSLEIGPAKYEMSFKNLSCPTCQILGYIHDHHLVYPIIDMSCHPMYSRKTFKFQNIKKTLNSFCLLLSDYLDFISSVPKMKKIIIYSLKQAVLERVCAGQPDRQAWNDPLQEDRFVTKKEQQQRVCDKLNKKIKKNVQWWSSCFNPLFFFFFLLFFHTHTLKCTWF